MTQSYQFVAPARLPMPGSSYRFSYRYLIQDTFQPILRCPMADNYHCFAVVTPLLVIQKSAHPFAGLLIAFAIWKRFRNSFRLFCVHQLLRLLRQITIVTFPQPNVFYNRKFVTERNLGSPIRTLQVRAKHHVKMLPIVTLTQLLRLLYPQFRQRNIVMPRRQTGFVV